MTVVPMVVSFGTQVWMARELGRLGLGEYHATALFITVLTTVLFFGFPAVAAQRIAGLHEAGSPHQPEAAGTAFTLALAFAAAMAAVAALAAGPFGRLFGLADQPSAMLLATAAVGASASNFAVHTFVARLALRAATAAIVAQPLGVAVGVAFRALAPELKGSELAVIGFVASGVLGSAILLRQGVRPRFAMVEVSYLLRRSAPAARLTYPAVMTGWIDRALVGILLGPAALGAFVAASALVETLQRFARAAGSLAVSAYARLTDDPVGVGRVLDSHLRLAAVLFIVSGAVFIAAGAGMLAVIYGPTFSIATTTLRLLSIAALPLTLAATLASHSVGADLRASGRMLALLALMHVVLATVLTLMFHIAGTALANVVVWGIGSLAYLRQTSRVGAPVQPRTFLHVAGVAAPVFSLAWIFGLQGWPWPITAVVAGSLGLVPAALLVGEAERRLLRRLIGRPRPDAR